MAIPEQLVRLWDDLVDFFKPVGGRGTGGYYPAPDCHAEGAENYYASPLQLDASGQVMTRGPVMTDEESFREDFPGTSIATTLTGTVTFSTGSGDVTGSGTSFVTELDRESYIKLTADGNTAYRRVLDVIDDETLELEEPYGTGGSGAAVESHFVSTIGTGGSISVANSICTIASGTTNGSETWMERWGDYQPMMFHAHASVSQRIANQEFHLGFVDSLVTRGGRAEVIFDGTLNTRVKFVTASSAAATDTETTTCTLPDGVTTAAAQTYEVTVTARACYLTVDGVKVASHRKHIPGPYVSLIQHAGWSNTGTPASSSSALIDVWFLQNQDRVEIANEFVGSRIPVRIEEDIHTLTGTLTTISTGTDMVICSYVVPSDKYLFVVGWTVASYSSTVNGRPVKVGKGALAESVSPGVVDSAVLRSIFLNQKQTYGEVYTVPRYLAAGGETVKITVTPDGVSSTVWRASLDYVLR
jgi:hypothetical protein